MRTEQPEVSSQPTDTRKPRTESSLLQGPPRTESSLLQGPPRSESSLLRGFTLIEILLVITIIGILMGLLLPAIHGTLNKARLTKAKAEVKSIEQAVRGYYAEYGKYPVSQAADKSYGTLPGVNNSALMLMLTGTDLSANPKQIPFLSIPNKSLDANGNFLDPWKAQYEITFDANYDNQCVLPGGAPVATVANNSVAVWSRGSTITQPTNLWVESWN